MPTCIPNNLKSAGPHLPNPVAPIEIRLLAGEKALVTDVFWGGARYGDVPAVSIGKIIKFMASQVLHVLQRHHKSRRCERNNSGL